MDIPGAAGHWSVKDIVSHITAYERWLVEWLTAAEQNTFPAPSPLDDADVERSNARVYEMTHVLPLQQVMDDAQKNFEALLNIIEVLSDEIFHQSAKRGMVHETVVEQNENRPHPGHQSQR